MSTPSSSSLQAACLAVGLASAWAPAADAGVVGNETDVHYTSSLSMDVHHAMVILDGGLGSGSAGDGGGVMFSNITIPAGTGSGGWTSFRPLNDFGNSFAMIGLAGGTGSGGDGGGLHLIMSLGHLTHIDGTLFTELFPGVSEAAIVDSLLTGTPLAESFLRDQYSNIRALDDNFSVVTAFSGAHDIGQISFSIPGPSAAAMGLMPLVAMVRRTRRR